MNAWQTVHVVLAWVTVFVTGGVGLWCLAGAARPQMAGRAKWVVVWVAYCLIFLQLTVGVLVVVTTEIEAPSFHVFYGVCAAVAVAVLYGYRHQLGPRRDLMFGLGSLFVMGLLIRGMFLG